MSPHVRNTTESDGCQPLSTEQLNPSVRPVGAATKHQPIATTQHGSNGIPLGSTGARPKSKSRRKNKSKKERLRTDQSDQEDGCQCLYKEIKREPSHNGKHYSLVSSSSVGFVKPDDGNCSKCKGKSKSRKDLALSSVEIGEKSAILPESIPISSSQSNLSRSHKYPKFENFTTRRLTYLVFVFPVETLVDSLIEAGFIYSGKQDAVTCYSCGQTQSGWSAADDPWTRHAQMNPDCHHIRTSGAHIPDDVKQTKHISSGRGSRELSSIKENCEEFDDAHEIMQNKKQIPAIDIEKIEAENERLRNDKLCKVCLSEDVSMVFLPCGHLVCCLECGNAVNVCPVCRAMIKASVRVHRPMGN